jgi:hypothetical protein
MQGLVCQLQGTCGCDVLDDGGELSFVKMGGSQKIFQVAASIQEILTESILDCCLNII